MVEQEESQAKVLEEYAGGVQTMSNDVMRDAILKEIDQVKAETNGKVNMGDILRRLLGPGGSLEGKPVERSEIARIVKEVLTAA